MVSLHVDTARTWRGGQNQVLLTVRGLRARGHEATIIAHPDGELRRRLQETDELIPLTPRTEMDVLAGWKLAQLIQERQPDILHVHDAHAVAVAALAMSFVRTSIPTRVVASRRVIFQLGQNMFSRWKYRRVDRFICASSFIRATLANDGIPSKRLDVVYEGVDLVNLDAAPRLNLHETFSLPENAPIVGNVGALDPDKGQRHLIKAAQLVIRKIPNAQFLIVGQGVLEATLRQQIKSLNLEKQVLLTGFRSDVLSLQKGFDVFVMSSLSEGLGTSVIDAIACGRPVDATNVGGLPELVDPGKTGQLVSPHDPGALADAILNILQDKALQVRYGHAASKRARQLFSAERMIDETLSIYHKMAGIPPVTDNPGPAATA